MVNETIDADQAEQRAQRNANAPETAGESPSEAAAEGRSPAEAAADDETHVGGADEVESDGTEPEPEPEDEPPVLG